MCLPCHPVRGAVSGCGQRHPPDREDNSKFVGINWCQWSHKGWSPVWGVGVNLIISDRKQKHITKCQEDLGGKAFVNAVINFWIPHHQEISWQSKWLSYFQTSNWFKCSSYFSHSIIIQIHNLNPGWDGRTGSLWLRIRATDQGMQLHVCRPVRFDTNFLMYIIATIIFRESIHQEYHSVCFQ
jgi:hypothetical protein